MRIRHSGVAFVALALAGVASANQAPTAKADGPSQDSAQRMLNRSSRRFIENVGQWNPQAEYLARTPGLDVWYTKTGLVFDAYKAGRTGRKGQRVAMRFVGGKSDFSGLGKVRGVTDYVAPTTGKRRTAGSYSEVVSPLYKGVSMRSYFDGGKPRYDLIVAPGTDASAIRMSFEGARAVTAKGRSMEIATQVGSIKQDGLEAYQIVDGVRRPVAAEFVQKNGVVGFRLGAYDKSLPLTIDPLVYGSYYGGNGGADIVASVVSDPSGITYMTGYTESARFPAIFGPYGYELQGSRDGFVARLQGDAYLHDYSAYFGGSGDDEGRFSQIDPFGNLWIVGTTSSANFPGARTRVSKIVRTTLPVANGGLRPAGEAQFRLAIGTNSVVLPFDVTAQQFQNALISLRPSLAGRVSVRPIIGSTTGELFNVVFEIGFEADFTIESGRILSADGSQEISQGLASTLAIYGEETRSWSQNARDSRQTIRPRGSRGSGPYFLGAIDPATGDLDLTEELNDQSPNTTVDTQIESLAGIGTNNVTVAGELDQNGLLVTFGGTLAGRPQPHLFVFESFGPDPQWSVEDAPGSVFLMRWKKDPTTYLNPLPSETRLISARTANGFAVQQIPNAPAGTAFDLVVSGTTTSQMLEVPQPFGRTSGYLLRYRYANGTLTSIANACRYISGNATVVNRGVVLDPNNNAYVAGTIFFRGNASTDPADPQYRDVFETTAGTYLNARLLRNTDAYVRKYNPDGSLGYSVLLGGNGDDYAGGYVIAGDATEIETGSAIAVDPVGNVYVTGMCSSFNFPRTRNVFGEIFTDLAQMYVTKINANASALIYSTNLRQSSNFPLGTNTPNGNPRIPRIFPADTNPFGEGAGAKPAGIAVDSRGNAYITGNLRPTYRFPVPTPSDPNQPVGQSFPAIPLTADALDGAWTSPVAPEAATTEGFLLVLNPTATGLVHGSYIGSYYDDIIMSPYVDGFGDVWVFGQSSNARLYAVPAREGEDVAYDTESFPVGELPATLLSPTAFKPVGEQGGTVPAERSFYNWATQGQMPFPGPDIRMVGSFASWDGFVTKIRVAAPTVSEVTITPSNVPGGFGATALVTVTLSSPAPVGGADIVLSISNSAVASFATTPGQDTITVSLDGGATTGTATITTFGVAANTQVQVQAAYQGSFKIAQFTVVPWLQQFTITPSSIIGGNEVNGRIVLAANAPANGVVAQLSTDDPSLISFPEATNGSITIPNGQNTFSFRIATGGVSSTVLKKVRVTILGVTREQDLTLTRAGLLSVAFSPNRVPGGDDAQGIVRLNGQAAVDTPVTVSVVGDSTGYVLRGDNVSGNTVIVRARQSSASFALTTPAVSAEVQKQVNATLEATTVSTVLTVFPDPAQVTGLVLNPTTVSAGAVSSGTVTISSEAPVGGISVNLSSSDTSRATVPQTVRIPEGQRTANFQVITVLRADGGSVVIRAFRSSSEAQATLTITPGTFTVSLAPASVLGGAPSTGTITVSTAAPSGGYLISLSSADPSVTVPATVLLPEGATTVSFPVTTRAVSSTRSVRITATLPNGTVGFANLEVRGIGLRSFTVSPADLRPNVVGRMTVTLESAPTVDTTITIEASTSLFTRISRTIVVRAGQTTGTGEVVSRRFARPLRTKIAARLGDSVKSVFVNLLR